MGGEVIRCGLLGVPRRNEICRAQKVIVGIVMATEKKLSRNSRENDRKAIGRRSSQLSSNLQS